MKKYGFQIANTDFIVASHITEARPIFTTARTLIFHQPRSCFLAWAFITTPSVSSQLDDGLKYSVSENLAIASRPAWIRDRAGLQAYLVEVLEAGVARRGSIHELVQNDFGDD